MSRVVILSSMVIAGAVLIASDRLGAQAQSGPALVPVSAAPAELAPAVARAQAAMKALQGTLLQRLMQELTAGGPAAAIEVCRREARTLTASVAAEHHVTLGRTSHKLRNEQNAAPSWAQAAVAEAAGKKAAEVQPLVADLGDKVGVLQPIPTGEPCAACHGPSAGLSAGISKMLLAAYPGDKATGFRTGDLRGWIWVEAPRQ